MVSKRKVCVITGTRAEYGLLYCLMSEIKSSEALELQVVVTGMHLSPEFGLTYKEIEKDGFDIDFKVEMLLSSDTSIGISKSMGLAMIGFSDAFSMLKPDLLVILGDRFEIFSAASVATIFNIPIAHIHGGETTEGAYDEAMRHSITKMSHLHFTAAEQYRKRVIQLGEQPERVYNFGAIGIDNIKRLNLLVKESFEESINFKLGRFNFLITYHPVTLEKSTSRIQFENLLTVLNGLSETHMIFTKANADTDGRVINEMIDNYVLTHPDRACVFTSLGQLRYLSSIQFMDAVIGNSSSGLLEVPSFKVATINVGSRQQGRIKSESVVDCDNSKSGIKGAIEKIYSDEFQEKIKHTINPFGNGGVSKRIVNVLCDTPLDNILKKQFFDSFNETTH